MPPRNRVNSQVTISRYHPRLFGSKFGENRKRRERIYQPPLVAPRQRISRRGDRHQSDMARPP